MRVSMGLKSIALMAILSMQCQTALAEGCAIEGVQLSCAKGANAQSVLEAFADAETTQALSNPIDKIERFKKPADLETFRRSLESTWRQVQRAERKERNKMHRRKISGTQFDEWAKTYARAEANYDKAINLYRTLVWHGKNGKPAPEDKDS